MALTPGIIGLKALSTSLMKANETLRGLLDKRDETNKKAMSEIVKLRVHIKGLSEEKVHLREALIMARAYDRHHHKCWVDGCMECQKLEIAYITARTRCLDGEVK